MNYVKMALVNRDEFPRPYWSSTSSNSIVRELVERADDVVRGELEELTAGGTIEKPVHEDITYGEVFQNPIYGMKSNRESGNGRPDLLLIPLDEGYENVLAYGICFCKKSCVVKCQKINEIEEIYETKIPKLM